MNTLTLYELAAQFHELANLADSDELPAEVIASTLEGLEGTFQEKAIQVARFILSLRANAAAVKASAKAQMERSARIERRADSVLAYLQFHMQGTQQRRIESEDVVLRLVKNPPAVVITDEHAIPPQFWVQPEPPPKRIDKKAIKAAIDAGERADGAYVEASERLDIRI